MAKGKTTYTNTRAWRDAFLSSLRKYPNVGEAAKNAGIARSKVYVARNEDPEFAAQWEEAWQDGIDSLELVAVKRATRIKNASDTLLIFMLKGLRPEIYRERFDATLTHRGSVGHTHRLDLRKLSDEELETLDTIYAHAAAAHAEGIAELGGSESGEGNSPPP